MAEARVVGVDINKLAQALGRARAKKRHVERVSKRIVGSLRATGLEEVCIPGARASVRDGVEYVEYDGIEALQRLHGLLAELRYYTDLLADARELEEFLDPEARELLDRAVEYREHLREMIRCKEG